MFRDRKMFVDLCDVICQNNRCRILLSIESALLKRGVRLAPGHRCRVGSHGFPECDMYLILHSPDLKARNIVYGVDITLAVCQVSETGFPDSKSIKLNTGKLV